MPDVIVVGGGVMGLSLAWRLASKGIRVRLLEAVDCGAEASGIAYAALWPPPADRMSPAHRLHLESLASYPEFVAQIERESSTSIEYRRLGRLELLPDPARQGRARRETELAECHWPISSDGKATLRIISSEEISRLEPCLASSGVPGLLCGMTAYVAGRELCRSLRKSCEARGVSVQENVRATGLLLERDRCHGVMTTNGEQRSDLVVVTAGAWTSAIFKPSIVGQEIVPAKGQVILVRPPSSVHLHRLIKSSRTYLIPTKGGEILMGSTTEPEAGFDKTATEAAREELLSRAERIVPGLREGEILEQWVGLRPQPERRRAVMGMIPGVKGLAVSSGHYKVGMALAPAASEWMARLLQGDKEACERLEPFAPTPSEGG